MRPFFIGKTIMMQLNKDKMQSALAALLSNPELLKSAERAGFVETIEIKAPEEAPIITKGKGKSAASVIDDMSEIEVHELLMTDASGLIVTD